MANTGHLVSSFLPRRHRHVPYRVWRMADGRYRCECLGFGFRGTCRHIRETVARSATSSLTTDEEQTASSKEGATT